MRVKTNRLDAISLAQRLRVGELTPVWAPDEGHRPPDFVRAASVRTDKERVERSAGFGWHRRIECADTDSSQHRIGRVRDHWHVDGDAVSPSSRVQKTGR